jgi:hypothetical protein
MNRTTSIAVAVCLILIASIGASAVAARQDSNPRQAGASSVYFFDVAATDTHGSGKLMINLDEKKFVFNGKDFEPSRMYVLQARAASGTDLHVFASAVATPSGNLHVEGTWTGDATAHPASTGFGVVAGSVLPGTIQRVAGEFCYTLRYTDASQTFTVYLPANEMTFGEGGQALPRVIPEPVPVDYVKTYSSTTLYFGYQGVSYTAKYYASPPYTPPVITVTGSYSPYRVWNNDIKVYDWYWNLHSVNTYDASHLPPGVVLQRVTWWITGTLEDGRTTMRVNQYTERWDGWPEFGFPPQELALTNSYTINDGYSWAGCYSPELCPADTWVEGPPFTAGCTLTTTDGGSYTASTVLTQA